MTSAQKHLPGKSPLRPAAAATPTPRHRASALLGLAAVLGLALAGCGTPSGGTASGGTATTPAATASAPAGTTASSMDSTARPMESTAPPVSASATTAAPALCTAASLRGALDDTGGGAAGHIYMKLILTNKSSTACILNGYPGVSLVKAGSTAAIGAPADRDTSAPSKGPITLVPGKSATAVLAYTQAGNYQDCQRVQAASVLVYPPSAYDHLAIPHPLTACSNKGDHLLKIGAFQP